MQTLMTSRTSSPAIMKRDVEEIRGSSFRLLDSGREFLNQLMHLGKVILVVRTKGLSCCRETEFGRFVRKGERQGETVFVDDTSGLSIDTGKVEEVVIRNSECDSLSIEFKFRGQGFGISVQPSEDAFVKRFFKTLLRRFPTEAVDDSKLVLAGAGAWLDEWLKVRGQGVLEMEPLATFRARFLGDGFSLSIGGKILSDFVDRQVHRITCSDEGTYLFAHQSVIAEC